MKYVKKTKVFIAFLFSITLLYLALRQVDFHQTIDALRLANYKLVLLASAAALALNTLRSFRWRYLIEDSHLLPIGFFIKAFFIGFLANSVLPARLGELVRAKALGDQAKTLIKTGGTKALSSVFLEKVLDGLMLLSFFMILLIFFPVQSWMKRAGCAAAALFFLLLIMIFAILLLRSRIQSLLVSISSSFPSNLQSYILNLFNRFSDGLAIIGNPRNMITFLLCSWIIWLFEGLIIFMFIKASNIESPVISGYFVMVFLGLGIALPSAPGYLGIYQFACLSTLSLWGVSESLALSFALIMQGATFIPMNLVGLAFLLFSQISLTKRIIPDTN